jgi:replication initiation protein RepC
MESGRVTTPFGRRSMTLGMLASQALAREVAPDSRIDKWKLYRALCEARQKLGIADRALSVLNALLSFHPKTELCGEDALVVFPSNAQLSLRTHGMAETTLRRHLAALVDAGLVIRKDSPNGKRYARKDRAGSIDEAFGFSLAPLLARAGEIEQLAAEVTVERLQLQRLRERMTLVRRDIAKLIETAIEEAVPGDWQAIHLAFRRMVLSVPRVATAGQLALALEEMDDLRTEIINHLEFHINRQKTDGNPDQNGRHIQNSKPESLSDLEPRFETKPGGTGGASQQPESVAGEEAAESQNGADVAEPTKPGAEQSGEAIGGDGAGAAKAHSGLAVDDSDAGAARRAGMAGIRRVEQGEGDRQRPGGLPVNILAGLPAAKPHSGDAAGAVDGVSAGQKPFPLALVLQACPEIVMFGPGGAIGSWRELMTAAVVVRSMLGVSPSAYEEACAILGPENAATVIACLLERSGHINSVGGYLRDLTRRAERGEFSLGPMLMALARANGGVGRRAG